jgi:hypothetical protein
MIGASSDIRQAILRMVAFFDTMDYAPSWTEVMAWGEFGTSGGQAVGSSSMSDAKRSLVIDGLIEEGEDRLALPGRLRPLLVLIHERTALFPRKLRNARKVARWLARNPAVRFVALANTAALAHSRDEGDLDFFVIVRHGAIWSTRLVAGTPYRLLGRLAGRPKEHQDAVCLSYFISDQGLDLSSHLLPGDDPYFRYWFLALLPLFDDGVSRECWQANHTILNRHPNAERWMTSPEVATRHPVLTIPGMALLEPAARWFQMRWFPRSIRELMNVDSSVMVNDRVLKFHVDDGREAYRSAYQQRLSV